MIAPDLPGHGGSTTNLEQFDVKAAAVMIWAVIDDLGYTKVRGIGYSAGGMTLLQMALMQPDRMSAMVLAASAHLNPVRQSAMTYEMLPEDFRQDLLRNHRGDEKKIRALLAMSYHSEITTKSLSALRVPTLLLSGDRDESFALYKVISTYEALPNAQLWIEPGLGHSLFWAEWGGDAALEQALPLRVTEFFKR
jgi:pimeloyl-ACP methyl ester carboxylesterase